MVYVEEKTPLSSKQVFFADLRSLFNYLTREIIVSVCDVGTITVRTFIVQLISNFIYPFGTLLYMKNGSTVIRLKKQEYCFFFDGNPELVQHVISIPDNQKDIPYHCFCLDVNTDLFQKRSKIPSNHIRNSIVC